MLLHLKFKTIRYFYCFFKNLENVGGFTSDDIDKYIALLNDKLDVNITKSLKGALSRYALKTSAMSVRKGKKAPPPLPVIDDGDRKDGDIGDKAGLGLKKVVWATPPFGTFKGDGKAVLGRHGNLLYNNITLMKKLQLMLGAQEAGNGGLKKDIAMFLDEAHKRRLISDWEHKHNMKVFVLNENAPSGKHKRSKK